jgi:hypothetical protein
MLRRTAIAARKNPVFIKYDNSDFTHQMKRLLQRKYVHYYKWDDEPLQMYPADRLAHANVKLDHRTGQAVYDPYRKADEYLVPDQKYSAYPIPAEYKDAYWIREREARRVQCPKEWVEDRYQQGWKYDLTDDSLAEKFTFSEEEVIAHARLERR